MASLAQALEATLSPIPDTRKAAEAHLNEAWKRPEHPLEVLRLIDSNACSPPVQQAAAVHFKNLVKHGWDESKDAEDRKGIVISPADRNTIKDNLVELMCKAPRSIQAQISESISLIAEVDFPKNWQTLLPSLVEKLHSTDITVVNGVLATANSIFKSFRYVDRSDELYAVIIYCLEKFQEPLLLMFKQICQQVEGLANDAQQLAPRFESLRLMCRIFFSLNYQDLPEFFEDHINEWMEAFAKFLHYKNPMLIDDSEEDEPGPVEKLQAAIIENLKLYADKDEECFIEFLPNFTQLVWNNLMSLSTYPKHDSLVTTSIKFLSSLVEKKMHNHLFQSDETLKQIITNIVIPNIMVRESDEEKFEDDPQEYLVTEIEGSDSESRQRCSRDLLGAMCRQFEEQTTNLCKHHITEMLAQFHANAGNWKAKDTAIHLMLGVAIRAESHLGVSEINPGVNVMEFLSSQVLPQLQDANHSSRPMLKATCLKFVYTFRKQFSKEQLLGLLPVLAAHLSSQYVVVHTLAAYGIERCLMTTEENAAGSKQFKIVRTDLTPHLELIFNGLFAIIENPDWDENKHVMKCAMRVIARAGQDVVPVTEVFFAKLVVALERVCKNPRNPEFNHCLFESIAALVRNCCSKDPAMTSELERLLFPPFQSVLQLDVLEFTPYVFQILAQLLEFRPEGSGFGEAYTSLFKPLLTAALWERKGNVPGLVRLLQAYLKRGANEIVGDLMPMLGIFQRLHASSSTEASSFDLLRAMTVYIPKENLLPHMGTLMRIIMTKLAATKAKNYPPLALSYFALVSGLYGGITLLDSLNQVQAGVGMNVLVNVWLPKLGGAIDNKIEAKIQVVGLTRILCDIPALLQDDNGRQIWAQSFRGIVTVLTSQSFSAREFDMDEIEVEVGYDAMFAQLSLAAKKPDDPFANIGDPAAAFVQAIHGLSTQHPGLLGPIIHASLGDEPKLASGFQAMMQQAGANLS